MIGTDRNWIGYGGTSHESACSNLKWKAETG